MGSWQTVFFLTASIYVFGNTVFAVFGKSEVQPWNEPSNKKLQDKLKDPERDVASAADVDAPPYTITKADMSIS